MDYKAKVAVLDSWLRGANIPNRNEELRTSEMPLWKRRESKTTNSRRLYLFIEERGLFWWC